MIKSSGNKVAGRHSSRDDVYWDAILDSLENVYLAEGCYEGVNTDMVLTKFEKFIPSPKRPAIPGYSLIYIIGLLSVDGQLFNIVLPNI